VCRENKHRKRQRLGALPLGGGYEVRLVFGEVALRGEFAVTYITCELQRRTVGNNVTTGTKDNQLGFCIVFHCLSVLIIRPVTS